MNYQAIRGNNNEIQIVVLNSNVFIPCDESNRDYQMFLQWCEQGNTPKEWTGE